MSTTVSAVPREHACGTQPEVRSWNRFRGSLAAVLAELENDQPLIISSKRGNRFVQFVKDVSSEGKVPQLRAEAVSNNYLSGPRRLTRKQIAALLDLGWSAPTHGDGKPAVPHGSANFYRDFEGSLPFGDIAEIAVRTLAEVRISCPEDLEYHSFQTQGGDEFILPTLGIPRVRPRPPREQTYREVRAMVLRTIREASGQKDLEMNDEGCIAVQRGDVVLHVHAVESPRFVRVCTPVLRDVTVDEALLRRLNEVNQGATFVRVLASDGAIWISADVFAYPLVPRHVVHACGVVADLASELRDELESEFGQRALFPKSASGGLKN